METNRQKKISGLLQEDLADVLQKSVLDSGVHNLIISVTKVSVTSDLSMAKVYLSVFPNEKAGEVINGIKSNAPLIKHEIAQRTKNQLRKMPDLEFFNDDSLEYIENIEQSLKGKEDPINNPDLLERRKKS